MKKTVKVISFILSFALIIGCIPLTVFGASIVDSGSCGQNLNWTFDSDGVLEISGTGTMSWYLQIPIYSGYNRITGYEYYYGYYTHRNEIKKVILNDGITAIAQTAFLNCTLLESIEIPDSVTEIKPSAFEGCSALKKIDIPGTVTSIGSCAFEGCTSLESIKITDGVESLSSNLFSGCESLKSVDIPKSVSTVYYNAFIDCPSLAEIKVADDNEYFYFLNNCLISKEDKRIIKALNGCMIPDDGSVEIIGSMAFSDCNSVTELIIPDSIKELYNSAFNNCTSLKSITVPSGITSFGINTFQNCTSLKEVNLPDDIEVIGEHFFDGCTSLKDIIIPDSVTLIDRYAFSGCSSLKNIVFSENLKDIEYESFKGCVSLENLVFPDSVEEMGSSFKGCTSLKTVSFPHDIAYIYSGTFTNCDELSDVYYFGTEQDWEKVKAYDSVIENANIHFIDKSDCCSKGHLWNGGIVTAKPNCKNTGMKTYFCTICNATKTETLNKNAEVHTGETEIRNMKNATCGNDGYTGDTYCKDCGVKISSGTTVKATGNHSWNGGTVTKQATCTEDGVKTFTCTVCKATKTEKIAKNSQNHTGGTEVRNAKSATCSKNGYTGDTYCKGCGVKLSDGMIIKATGNHSWDNGVVTTKATASKNGVMTYTCTVCKATKTVPVYYNHTHSASKTINAVAATCKNNGNNTYYQCSCGMYFADKQCKIATTPAEQTVAQTNKHTYGKWSVKTAPTYEKDGVQVRYCTVCKAEETAKIDKLVASESAKDENTGIQLGFADGIFESGVKLEVKTVAEDNTVYKALGKMMPDTEFELFDISVTKDNAKVQPNGNVKITIPVPESFKDENVTVYYVNDLAETEKLQSYVKDGKIVFETNHFSYYAIVNEASVTLGDVNGDTKINTKDARLILRYAAKLEKFTPEQEKAADVNNDTKVNTKDARKILRVVAKLETM